MPGIGLNRLGQYVRVSGSPIYDPMPSERITATISATEARLRDLRAQVELCEGIVKRIDRWLGDPAPETQDEKRERVKTLVEAIWRAKKAAPEVGKKSRRPPRKTKRAARRKK
jgi:hypothetical protein